MSIRDKMNILYEKVTTDKLVSRTGLEEIVSQIMRHYNLKLQEINKETMTEQEITELLNKLN